MGKVRVLVVIVLAVILGLGFFMPLSWAGGALHALSIEREAASQGSALVFHPPAIQSIDSLGDITWNPSASPAGVVLLHPSIHARSGKLTCQAASVDPNGNTVTITYATETRQTVRMTATLVASANALAITLNADQPILASVDFGSWPSELNAKKMAVPYYTGNVWYVSGWRGFVNAWWDFHETHGTQFNGSAVKYMPRTDGSVVPLHEKLVVVASSNVDDTFPSPANPASPYMSELTGRMVEDIWTPGFQVIRDGLEQLGDYGITNCIGIIHDWQHAGYDNGLPQHYPANDKLGGDAALKAAIAAGKADGCLMALHENYIDYYPNYPGFNPAAVAAKDAGQQALAWRNGMGIQAFQTKPSWMVKNASTQSPSIHQIYGTDASFLDVNSAVSPYHMRDMDPASPFGGTMQAWMKSAADLWAYERKTYDGPTFGEGAAHWYYSGLLDGVEAQFGTGSIPQRAGANVPLFVDFDLLEIHPLQVNHGMGYYERWTPSGSHSMTTAEADAYRMQEVAFGHAPFLGTQYWNDIPHALVESGLVGSAAKSYATQHVRSIRYQVNGNWTTSSAASEAGVFDRVSVEYANGLQVVANANASTLQWNSLTLPQYGWVAEGKDLVAYTALCGNQICDYSQTPTSIFANARNQSDLTNSGSVIKPSVASVKAGPGRTFSIEYNWTATQKLTSNYKFFVHFVNDQALSANSGIVFQGDHPLPVPTSQWQLNQVISDGPYKVSIPASVSDRTYSIRVGLTDPSTGARIPLSGENDGTQRYILGYITISGQGSSVSFVPVSHTLSTQRDVRLNADGKTLNFGTVQTDAMISIRLENGQWVLRPFPRNRTSTILLNSGIFPVPSQVKSSGGSTPSVTAKQESNGWWTISLNGAKSYTWPAVRPMLPIHQP